MSKFTILFILVVLRWNIQGGVGICGKSVFESELGKNLLLQTPTFENYLFLDANLEIFDFVLSESDMALIDGLNLNERKLVPIITLNDGTKAPRDGKHIHYPYHEEF